MKGGERVWKKLGDGEEEERRGSEEGGEEILEGKGNPAFTADVTNSLVPCDTLSFANATSASVLSLYTCSVPLRMEYSQGLSPNTNARGPADICRTAPPRPIE